MHAATAWRSGRKERWAVNKVLLTGRLTRDPELRVTSTGKSVATFNMATHEYAGPGKEKSEFHTIVTWDKLAEVCGRWLGKGQQVGVEGRIQTRSWDDDRGARHWRTEIVANNVEMLSSRRKRDFAADAAADGRSDSAERSGVEPLPAAAGPAGDAPADDDVLDEAAA
jgi:single-strand DNA-binding protein